MAIKLGVCGTGSFASLFIPLFKLHPLVEEVVLSDLDAAKLQRASEQYEIPKTCPSLDALCDSDVDAIAIITQNWMHGPQAVQALRAGKHVYSAVPPAITMEQITELVKAVKETGKVYMLGETSYYYPAVLYCRERFRRGDFGRIVYAEAEYYHDFDHGLYEVFQMRGGERWRKIAGSPPMHYPTHSTSQIISVTGAHATHVSCQGFIDSHEDGLFKVGVNRWDNVFSNECALFRMSDGSAFRVNEFRRVGHPGAVRMTLFGAEASFEDNLCGQVWCNRHGQEYIGDLLALKTPGDTSHPDFSVIHPIARIPEELKGFTGGHAGAEVFLVDDFVEAAATGETPPLNVWIAARYMIPGIIAHESAVQGGKLLEVPDFGDALV